MYTNNIKEQQYTKESITILADEAKTQISRNKYLLEMIDIFNQQISMVKSLIKSYSSHNIQKKSKDNNPALNYKNQLSSLNAKLKEEINKNNKKHENLLNNISKESSEVNQTLSQFYIDNFILNNTISKYNYEIKALNDRIEASKKYDIFREPKRESELDIKESKNIYLIHNLETQQKMLSFCRSYVSNKYKNIKKKSKIKELIKQVNLLKKYVNYYSYKIYGDETKGLNDLFNFNSAKKNENVKNVDIKKRIGTTPHYKKQFENIDKNNKINEEGEENKKEEEIIENNNNDNSFNKTSFFNDGEISLFKNINEDENNKNKTEEKKERKRINILNIDELLDIENIEVEDEDIIDNELNSDDEVFFETKIKPKKKIKTHFLSDLKKNVPSINLSQIEFNKLKVINEADAYSLQKRKFEQGNINGKINNVKKQIKHMEKKIGMNRKKLNVIHNFIEDVKYNYKLLRPIKVHTSAAGNPVNYIREKLLNIVEETITQSEKKENKENDKFKTGKTAVEEGEDDDQNVGSDYSDEDEYIGNFENKENEINNINIDEKKQINNIIKQNNNKIKTNLISKFVSNEKEDEEEMKNKHMNKYINNNFNNKILENAIAQSK